MQSHDLWSIPFITHELSLTLQPLPTSPTQLSFCSLLSTRTHSWVHQTTLLLACLTIPLHAPFFSFAYSTKYISRPIMVSSYLLTSRRLSSSFMLCMKIHLPFHPPSKAQVEGTALPFGSPLLHVRTSLSSDQDWSDRHYCSYLFRCVLSPPRCKTRHRYLSEASAGVAHSRCLKCIF